MNQQDEPNELRVDGAPLTDLLRSEAARRIGAMAQASELFMFDYEARVQLELPDVWLPIARPDLGVTGRPPSWDRGVLPESKYLSFRHDLMVGSLHAGHRAKWTAHELCHRLVGFAWDPNGSVLFHALAARLAEALPVAVWYFFDEAGLRRCPRHAGQTEVGPGYCAGCEAAALLGPVEDVHAERWIERGLAFLREEIAAVRNSIAERRPVYSPHGPIDLMSDGLAYASAHLERLRSPEMAGWVARFCAGADAGWHADLEGLIARVEAVARGITGAGAVRGWTGGRWRWVAQDLGARLLQVAAETDGECFLELDRLVDRLAANADEGVVGEVIADYERLFENYDLPEPTELFAVGYPLPHGHGRSVRQLRAGLETCAPAALRALGDLDEALVTSFCGRVTAERRPLGERFASFLEGRMPGSEAAAIARFEAAIAHARPADSAELALGWDGAAPETVRLATGVAIVRAPSDVAAIVLAGADTAEPGARSWLVRRDAAEEVGLTAITEACADQLMRVPIVVSELPDDHEIDALIAEGFLVPDQWDLTVSHAAAAPAH